MTNKQKEELAGALISRAGELIDDWAREVDTYHPELKGVSSAEAAEQLAKWLKHLPGNVWDVRLPEPKR